jgi:hypothetical protein
MRKYNTFSAIFVVSLLGSISMVDAQTGEFAATVPAEVVRAGQALQDAFQAARSRKPVSSTDRTSGAVRGGVTIIDTADPRWKSEVNDLLAECDHFRGGAGHRCR